jgi:hypothetical protein
MRRTVSAADDELRLLLAAAGRGGWSAFSTDLQGWVKEVGTFWSRFVCFLSFITR